MIKVKNIILIFAILSILISSLLALWSFGEDEEGEQESESGTEEPMFAVRNPGARADFTLYQREHYNGIVYETDTDGMTVAKSGDTSIYHSFGDVRVKDGRLIFEGVQNDKLLLFERVRCAQNYTESAISFEKHDFVLAVFDFKAIGAYDGISISPVLRKTYDSEYGESYLTPFSYEKYANSDSKTITILFEVIRETDELNYYVFFDGVVDDVVTGFKNASQYYFSAFEIGFTIQPSLESIYYELGNASIYVSSDVV